MIVSTSNEIKNNELGIVTGCCVTSKVFYKDFFASVRRFFGWELKEYTEMLEDARTKAVERMVEAAEKLGAYAIINVRFTSSEISRGASEILAYGTAIKLEDKV